MMFLAALSCAVAYAIPAEAQRYQVLGPAKCIDCHDHKPEKDWWEKRDGSNDGRRHINALNRLEDAKSAKYAKAVGLADVYDLKGSCVACHATVFKGDARAGISCESCHDAGSGYLEIHKEKDSYAKAVAAGMRDVVGKPARWAADCMKCHVMDDKRLIDAGHPSGDDFDLGTKFKPVAAHFKANKDKYTAAQIAPFAAGTRRAQIAKRGAAAVAQAVPPPPPAPSSPLGPQPGPEPVKPGPSPPPPAGPPPTPGPGPSSGSGGGAPSAGPKPDGPKAGQTGGARPAGPGPVRPRPPASVPPATPGGIPPAPPPPLPAPVVVGPEAAPVPAVDAMPMPPLPRSPAAVVGAVQGRLALLLEALLSRGARTAIRVTPPEDKTPYRGADAELLRLQEEVISLAIEALGTAPKAPARANTQ